MTLRWKHYRITNLTRSTMVCQEALLATRMMDRLRGLLGKKGLDAGSGLLIDPCSGVHTCGMGFALDIVALNRSNRVTGLWLAVDPWRIRGMSLRTSRMLELAAGALTPSATRLGDELWLEELHTGGIDSGPAFNSESSFASADAPFLAAAQRAPGPSVNDRRDGGAGKCQT